MLLSQLQEPVSGWQDLRVLFIGGYWMGDNDLVKMWLRSLNDLTPGVYEYSTEEHRDVLDTCGRPYDYGRWGPVYVKYEAVREIIESHRPHLIVCCAGGLSLHPEVAQELRKRHCLVGMALSDPDIFEPATSKIAGNFDLYFTNSREAAKLYRQVDVDAIWLPFANYPKYHQRLVKDPRYECDVLFVGQARPDRVELVNRIASMFRTKVFGTNWNDHGVANEGMLPSDQVIPAVNSASVCLDFARNLAGDYMVKYRIFEVAGCGAVVCTEQFDELAVHFEFGKEILGYNTDAELLEQIGRCVRDPDFRAKVGENAYQRSRGEHTFAHRWTSILEKCELPLPPPY